MAHVSGKAAIMTREDGSHYLSLEVEVEPEVHGEKENFDRFIPELYDGTLGAYVFKSAIRENTPKMIPVEPEPDAAPASGESSDNLQE